ncbi:short chain dehydrogenase [Hirsutella rhossiliensis]|uniref:Short chain dehydrogenase domain-containing protein n=1 Tax=Hirsutella rhossiliensis TaxID=111463 RepID=A0A9P8MVA6_9HYPO|nr:short chain dehydrogenase domain-containing protein [Hirsutella rhossiliensis]KAH0961915.1 short chain dehydrogenase domain-containing protein [Hirsutella rhossiliensis]
MAWRGYDPDRDIPDLSGKVILVTGGTGGIGKHTVVELAKHAPAHIFFTGRNRTAADAVVAECRPLLDGRVTFVECDHGSLASIRSAAEAFFAASGPSPRLDVFVANAGIMAVPLGATVDGYKAQFGVNHLGNAALLLRLLPVMLHTAAEPGADVRFVTLTSRAHFIHPHRGIDFDRLRAAPSADSNPRATFIRTWMRYGQSKLANILTAAELRRRHPQITSVAIHPGIVRTGLVTRMGALSRLVLLLAGPRGLVTPLQGSYNTLWGATGPGVRDQVAESSARQIAALFWPVGEPKKGDAKCWDGALAQRLWDWTVKEVGVDGSG